MQNYPLSVWTEEGSTFTPNYYEALTGNRLGTNPRKIHRCYIPEAANVNSGLKIEDGSPVEMSE